MLRSPSGSAWVRSMRVTVLLKEARGAFPPLTRLHLPDVRPGAPSLWHQASMGRAPVASPRPDLYPDRRASASTA
jgi:hypothetical protein